MKTLFDQASRRKTADNETRDRTRERGAIRVGIAGWKYGPWRGSFYPKGLVQKKELEFASRALPTIEVNSTFYRLQQAQTYARWYDETPQDFMFSVKASRVITHERRLRDIEKPLAGFLASGLLSLKEKLGPILWQFPPTFRFDKVLFEDFLAQLPHDNRAAGKIIHDDDRMSEYHALAATANRPLRHAVEIRNDSFMDPAFVDMLRRHDVALVVADAAAKWPEVEDVCTDFMYLRLHGDAELYASGYTEAALDRWANRILAWAVGSQPDDAHLIATREELAPRIERDVFCYFDNTVKVRAPSNASRLLEKLGIRHGAQI